MIGPREAFEPRRRKELREELLARARVWLPDWRPSADQQGDFVTALLDIAARLESEVTQRLDRIPDKTFRGFLYWLGVRGDASRAARLPVVFSMSAGAERVLAPAQVQLQATPVPVDASQSADPVTFETDSPLMVTPGRLASVVAADPGGDAFFLPGPGFSPLEAPTPGADTWRAVSDTLAGSTQLQLEPTSGLDVLPKLLHVSEKKQYRVTKADGNLVTLDPPLETPVTEEDEFRDALVFEPFPEDGSERNRQEHALYIGSEAALNLPTTADIAIEAGGDIQALGPGDEPAEWAYWGKKGAAEEVAWQALDAPAFKDDRILLEKQAGSVEIVEIDGKKSRWLRALKPVPSTSATSALSGLKLKVNCDGAATSCPPKGTERSTVAVEAIANTTPLVLDIPFLPLGREPKLFDAFYIGCPEAFSKKNASVRICLQALDGTTESLTAIALGTSSFVLLFGIGRDGQLHRLWQPFDPAAPLVRLTAVRPPFSDLGVPSVPAPAATINQIGPSLLSAVSLSDSTLGQRALVGVTAGNNGWIWSQNLQSGASRWHLLGPIFDLTNGAVPVSDDSARIILLTTATGVHAVGVNRGVLYEADLGPNWETSGAQPQWKAVPVPTGRTDGWKQIVPVFDSSKRWSGADLADGWVAVDAVGAAIFKPDVTGKASLYPTTLNALGAVAVDVTPLAVRTSDNATTLIVHKNGALTAWLVGTGQIVALTATKPVGTLGWTIDTANTPSRLAVLFSVQPVPADPIRVATWFPRDADIKAMAYSSDPVAGVSGGPAVTPLRVVMPGTQAVYSMTFDLNGLQRLTLSPLIVESALVVDTLAAPFVKDDFVETTLDGVAGTTVTRIPADAVQSGPHQFFLRLTPSSIAAKFTSADLYNREVAQVFTGTVVSDSAAETEITLEVPDHFAHAPGKVVVEPVVANATLSVRAVSSINPSPNPTSMKIVPGFGGAAAGGLSAGDTINYEYVRPAAAARDEILPFIDVRMLAAGAVSAVVENGAYVVGAGPSPNAVKFVHPAAPPTESLVLAAEWNPRPTLDVNGLVVLFANAMYGPIAALTDAKNGSPKLSWEYWDGHAWWKIKNLNDGTDNLQSTGAVSFCVPAGLQPTDVAGRTSHWIRARLVEGDYGKEKVTIKSNTNTTTGVTTQTVDRDLSGITPPHLASIDLTYKVCCAVVPDFVLTKDANAFRNQSEANRIPGATVEFFVPLAATIHQASSAPSTATPPPEDMGLAIYLGFDAEIADGPINVLFLLNDGVHDEAFPLRVDVLRERGFERLVTNDGTRGLNETGVVSLNLAAPPPEVALFGSERRWLRVRPREGFLGGWRPKIRAAYLNGVFASAAETQRLERLGSSDGSPGQRKLLARPPVIKDSLELRVREPLGDEEMDALRQQDPNLVRDDLAYPGRWVLWTPVLDPDDAGKDDRVYALDHETGEITFGDGTHGRIPPIGTDSILAVRYQKGGGDAANHVNAWGQVSLVTALSGVQTVAAPEGAAGGSDPQDAETVLRFAPANQLMRDRTLTLRDFEMQALQFSPDVAQAHAYQKDATVHLVVVMAGRNPVPSQSVRRELARYLGSTAVPMLAAHGGIVIEPPEPIEIRVDLTLGIERIEHSADVAPEARRRVAALLDPAVGGVEKIGWQLGETPTETDIAAVLDDLERLEEIQLVKILNADTGAELTGVDPHQLATLAPDGVTFRFRLLDEAGVGA